MLNLKYPEVRRFYRAAEAHRDAARLLVDACPKQGSSTDGHDVVYLSGYIVECSLKALYLDRVPNRRHDEVVVWFKSDVMRGG